MMENLLYETIDYKIDETPLGTWRSFLGINGSLFREFVSHRKIYGVPLIHYSVGKDPATGRRRVAFGIIAIGRMAVGVVAVGQLSVGVIAVGQAAFGLLFGLGQLTTGVIAIGQFAIGLLFGLGQFASGYVTIGQMTTGYYSLAQISRAKHAWTQGYADPIAKAFFRRWLGI